MAHSLVTNSNRLNIGKQIIESVTEPSNTAYYVFVGDHHVHPNTELQPVYDDVNMKLQVYRNMIFGKRVSSNDLKLMIRNIPYESNTVYAMYDDSNTTFFDNNFYAVVNAVSYHHVFKCLDNNNGSVSTIAPDFAHISGSNTYVYETADGYRWKYMYSVDAANVTKFETQNYFPVIANTAVQAYAQKGAIDIIKVEGQGRGYDNYVSGTFDSSDIRVGGNTILYKIGNSIASSVNGFYTDCLIYISTGTGSGQYRTITDYYANNIGKYFVVNSAFTTIPTDISEYQITPRVNIIGGGSQTVNAVGRALVNSLSSNSIYRIEMLERGLNYFYITANVTANAVVNVTSNSIVRPIYSPLEGHGFDAAEELGAKRLSFTVKITGTESDTITIDNRFQQIGLMRDPLFANVVLNVSGTNGEFADSEQLFKMTPVRINSNVTTDSTNTTVVCATGDFENQIAAGDYLYLKSGNSTLHQLALVNSVTNSSYLELTTTAAFSCTETIMYQANLSSNAYITTSNSSTIRTTNVHGIFETNDQVIGGDSGAIATVNSVSRNGVEKSFNTFQQMYKYTGTLTAGSFTENEVVYQGNLSVANAFLHSAGSNSGTYTIYTSNQVGTFQPANTIVGNTSGAIATINEVFSPEVVPGSGELLFVENLEPITRSSNTSETLRIIFEY